MVPEEEKEKVELTVSEIPKREAGVKLIKKMIQPKPLIMAKAAS
jgi:hypothetical protein